MFPMGLMHAMDGTPVPYAYDSGASQTSILAGSDGIIFPTAPVSPGEEEWQRVNGVGGETSVGMVYILVPLVDGSLTRIKAQVIQHTLQCQTRNMKELAEEVAIQAISDGYMEEQEEIQCPRYEDQAVLLLGRSHEHLAPRPVYRTERGLTLYAGCIDGPGVWKYRSMRGGQRTLCIGGSLLDEEDSREGLNSLMVSGKEEKEDIPVKIEPEKVPSFSSCYPLLDDVEMR